MHSHSIIKEIPFMHESISYDIALIQNVVATKTVKLVFYDRLTLEAECHNHYPPL